MKHLIEFLIVFSAIFLFDLIFVVLNKKKRAKIFSTSGALIIKSKFKVDFENEDKKKFAIITALADSFICASAYTVLRLFNNIYIGFIVAALTLGVLIIGVYFLIGYLYKKKEGKKNV